MDNNLIKAATRSGSQNASQRLLHPGIKRLHLGHFAFMRAVLQGVDPKVSWDRYLRYEGVADDSRAIRQTIQWVRDEFAAAAKRHARHGTARLILIDAARVQERTAAVPTLDEFVDESQLHDFSYQEQLEFYEERYGRATQQQSRRARLVFKQLEALRWLESIAVQPPRPDDPVSAWLNPTIARLLERAGIATLRHLSDRINGVGRRWSAAIPAVGRAKADRIVDWMRQQEPALRLTVGPHVDRPRSSLTAAELHKIVPRATAIVPLDKLLIPPPLSGASGANRAPTDACLIDAGDDRAAVLAWLSAKAPAAHTRRAYLKEAERLILWAVLQQGTPLSAMTTEDCLAYCRFLANPVPADKWCGPRGRAKWSPLWRPFEGPLSVRAQRAAITVLKNLFKYLHQQNYLASNPWEAVALPGEVTPRTNRARSFTETQWHFLETMLSRLPETSANQRLKLALPLLYATGMRLMEAVSARVGDLRRQDDASNSTRAEGAGRWRLRWDGRGGSVREAALPDAVADQLSAYLAARGLPAELDADANRDAALLGKAVDVPARAPWSALAQQKVDPKAGISAGALYDQIKEFFGACAAEIPAEDAPLRRAFESASTEWLRHTHARRVRASP